MIRKRLSRLALVFALICGGAFAHAAPAAVPTMVKEAKPGERLIQQLDELSALWSFYKRSHIRDGRVIALDEGGITTSEGQSYAMLRAVWQNDRETFQSVWRWKRDHLQVRKGDKLFAWKWSGKVVEMNAASDADTDIALALLLASSRFSIPQYEAQAREFFMSQHPHLSAKFRLSDRQEAELSAGPAFQFVRDSSLDGVWQVGANASAGYNARFTERLNWKIGAGYVQVANKFNQVQIDNSLRYTF